MSTTIRPELSEKNKYWIERHRFYELRHFCLQYPIWKKAYIALDGLSDRPADLNAFITNNVCNNPTERCAIAKAHYAKYMNLIESVVRETDPELAIYILEAVTEEVTYEYLKTVKDIPCCRDTYYDRYRKFFWLLNKSRD